MSRTNTPRINGIACLRIALKRAALVRRFGLAGGLPSTTARQSFRLGGGRRHARLPSGGLGCRGVR